MDFDNEVRNIAVGDYLYALNLRNSITDAHLGGTATNMKGNALVETYNSPYNNGVFPEGENIVIGSCEDIQYHSSVFAVWNSRGKHWIGRYWRDRTDALNPYGVVDQVIQYDFGWQRDERILSMNIVYGVTGDLLYWTDSVQPRKINLTKGNIVGKQKSWDVILPVTTDGNVPQLLLWKFLNKSGGTVYQIYTTTSTVADRAVMVSEIANLLEVDPTGIVTTDGCGCHFTITEKVAGTIWSVTVDTPAVMIVPDNWYGGVLIDRFFDRCKWPFLNPPLLTYEQDSDYEPNYVKNKVFQARLQPRYDDNEGTDLALGVWSQIPINNLGCDGTSNPLYNYIDINFNDSTIANAQTLVILKQISLIAREQNTGSDRRVIRLEQCDFLDYADGEWVCHFKFYNDIISSPIDTALTAKLFDDVPIKADAELAVKNRMVEGGILEGYDAPECVEAEYAIDFSPDPNPKLHKISGRIRIMTMGLGNGAVEPNNGSNYTRRTFYNTFPDYRKYPFWQHSNPDVNYTLQRGGIFHDTTRTSNDFAYYGGGGYGYNNNYGQRSGMEDIFDQRIPEGGWPVYAADTNYFTVSKQVNIGLPTDSNGALDTSSTNQIDSIGDYYGGGNDLYSEWEMLVPDGTYVIRLASHWCSFGDKLGKGFAYDLNAGVTWQRTSTNVWGYFEGDGDAYQPSKWKKGYEIVVTVSGGDVFVGTFVVADLAPIHDVSLPKSGASPYTNVNAIFWQPINGYLYSSSFDDGRGDINSNQFDGLPVEKTIVGYGANGIGVEQSTASLVFDPTWVGLHPVFQGWQESAITDHNGYWFGIGGAMILPDDDGRNHVDFLGINMFPLMAYQTKLGEPNNVWKIRELNYLFYQGTVTDYYNKTLQAKTLNGLPISASNGDYGLRHGFIAATTAGARQNGSTFIEGTIIDSTTLSPIPDVGVIYTNGQTSTTNVNGDYSILAWSDMLTPNLVNMQVQTNTFVPESSANRTVDYVIVNGGIFCIITYPNGNTISITIDPYGQNPGQYNPLQPYTVGDFAISEGNNPSVKAHKRGGNYTYGVRLYDNAGRLCSVTNVFDVYVPFLTEDLNKYFPNQYPVTTYKHGKPTISWTLSANTRFPSWATRMQWMRTTNTIYGRYLQWVANQVTYVAQLATETTPEIDTSFQNRDATAIKISLSNIITFFAQNNSSQIGYNYEVGDRVRLIADRNLQYYDGLNDFEVTGYEASTQSIILKNDGFPVEIQSGCLFEIFNPKSVETEDAQIFYEVGEVIPINNGVPASFTGTFSNGDTYWHGRLITVTDDATKFAAAYPVVIESASVSDFYSSQSQDIGRIGIIDPNFKQVYNPAKMRVSNDYQTTSALNGLSAFEELNQKELDRTYGSIKRLLFVNNSLVAVMENKETSNYIGLVTLMQASRGAESGVVATSDNFFGTEYIHSKLLGTDFGGTVAVKDSTIFGYNNYRATAWKYQGDGENAISDIRMVNYFKQLKADGITDAISVYDRYRDEYILTVRKSDGTYETVAWNETKQRWTTFYSFHPECYGILGNEIVSFRDGKVWLHDVNETYNSLYGQQYPTKLHVVFNAQPDMLKVWNACTLKTLQADNNNDWSAPVIKNDNGQLSRLAKGSWVKKGENWYSSFKRDLNDVSKPLATRIVNGRDLRSSSLTAELENDADVLVRLYSWDANWSLSERTSK